MQRNKMQGLPTYQTWGGRIRIRSAWSVMRLTSKTGGDQGGRTPAAFWNCRGKMSMERFRSRSGIKPNLTRAGVAPEGIRRTQSCRSQGRRQQCAAWERSDAPSAHPFPRVGLLEHCILLLGMGGAKTLRRIETSLEECGFCLLWTS